MAHFLSSLNLVRLLCTNCLQIQIEARIRIGGDRLGHVEVYKRVEYNNRITINSERARDGNQQRYYRRQPEYAGKNRRPRVSLQAKLTPRPRPR